MLNFLFGQNNNAEGNNIQPVDTKPSSFSTNPFSAFEKKHPTDSQKQHPNDLKNKPVMFPGGEPPMFPRHEPLMFPKGEPPMFPRHEPSMFPKGEPPMFPRHEPLMFPKGEPPMFPRHEPPMFPMWPSHPFNDHPSTFISNKQNFVSTGAYKPAGAPTVGNASVGKNTNTISYANNSGTTNRIHGSSNIQKKF